VLAILGASIAGFANAGLNWLNNRYQLDLEEKKSAIGPTVPAKNGPVPGFRSARNFRIFTFNALSEIKPESARNLRFSAAFSGSLVFIISRMRVASYFVASTRRVAEAYNLLFAKYHKPEIAT
jgi:hypothetical protein